MRDVENVDHDLSLVMRLRSMLRKQGIHPTMRLADQLLDERLMLMRDCQRRDS